MKKIISLLLMMWISTLVAVGQDDTLILKGKANPTATLSGYYHICGGDTVTIPISLTNGPTWDLTIYDGYVQWTIPGVTASPYALVVSPTNTKTYTVSTVNNGSCSNSGTGAATVIIDPPPTIFTVSCTSTTFCAGGNSGVFTTSGSTPGDLYQLFLGGIQVMGATVMGTGSAITLPEQPMPGVYTVEATNPTGCTSIMNGTIILNTYPSVGNATIINGLQTICEGASATFSTNTIPNATDYVWSVPLGAVISSNTGTSVTVVFGNQSGSVSVFGQNACGGGQPFILPITVNLAPTLTVTASPANICSGTSTMLTASTNGNTFTWSNGLGTTNSVTATPTGSTTYFVTVAGSNNCTITGSVAVTVNPLPNVTLTLAQDNF
ncbi:MAG: hypothetical protein WC606_03510, partial [Candidatus Absconditabacterales bacterium]